MSKVFEVIKLDSPMPWTVKHKPTGLYAGSFYYRAYAIAAAASLESVAAQYPELSRDSGWDTRESLAALLVVRAPHANADQAQAKAAEAKRKQKKVRT